MAVIPPFVYRHSEAGLLRHFVAVAASVPELPVYLYNFPAICNNTLTVELVQQIMEEAPNVVGMKDSSGSLDALAELVAVTGGRFNAVSGPDGLALMALALGFDGCVSGNANVVPELMVSLYDAVKAGEMARARKCQERLNRVRALLQDGGNLGHIEGTPAPHADYQVRLACAGYLRAIFDNPQWRIWQDFRVSRDLQTGRLQRL